MGAAALCKKHIGQEQQIGTTCLTSDRARRLELQELLTSWHEAVWGREAVALYRDPPRTAALQADHLQALGAVEDALREAEHDATSLGALGPGVVSLEGFLGSLQSATGTGDEEEKSN